MKKRNVYCAEKLLLSNIKPFAEGGNRLCFIHPQDANLCVKIVKESSIAALRARRGFIKNLRPDSAFDDNMSEYIAYQQSAIVRGGSEVYDCLPRCYGWQETDIGAGLISDYYSSEAGAAQTLDGYLKTYGMTDEMSGMLNELAQWLRHTQILTKNILPHNVVIAEDGKLKLIDGLGVSSPFNIARFNAGARKNYIEKRVKRMYLRIDWELSDKSNSWRTTEAQNK